MAANRKLTGVIRGRTIEQVEPGADGTAWLVHFDDGSTLTVRTVLGAAPARLKGRVVKARQSDTRLQLDLADGRTLEFATAEPASSVLLRGQDGTLQYAD
jgi:hypothetical protein